MANADKRYYWLKLKRDFFKRHDIKIIESMPNGKDYLLFYLKLLCESVDHDGNLRFSESIPYNEEMLATITDTNVDIVRSAIKIFTELGMMEIMDDGTYFMREVEKMIGSESYWAEAKRRQRLDNVQQMSLTSPTCPSKSQSQIKSKSIEKDIESDLLPQNSICDGLTEAQWDSLEQNFEDVKGLIDLIDRRLGLNISSVKNPYSYILKVAKDERWATKS